MKKANIGLSPNPDAARRLVVELTEWGRVGPAENADLKGISLREDVHAQQIADALRGRVDIREGYRGLEIAATSFVGRVSVGPVHIIIRPKLPAAPLTRLLRYAYSLRDVSIVDVSHAALVHYGFHDLLIAMLADEVEELIFAGLARRYVPLTERLQNPRGRILVDQVMRRGGVKDSTLPCLHFERSVNWHLNQVLRAGLDVAAGITEDNELRRRVHRLADMFGDVGRAVRLDIREIEKAAGELTRLTEMSRPALTIIKLLHDLQGIGIEATGDQARTPGLLFDMNLFFERLLSRFLRENLKGARVLDQQFLSAVFAYAPEANPQNRAAPTPRPDYTVVGAGCTGFLDAKYRDIWEGNLPAEWLYQLSIYGLASPARVSILLYATMAVDARDQRIEVRQPWSREVLASVIVRPVLLPRLAELLGPGHSTTVSIARQRWADDLVASSVPPARAGSEWNRTAVVRTPIAAG